MEELRKPLQGVWNIIRFNWHYYAILIFTWLILFFIRGQVGSSLQLFIDIFLMLSILLVIVSIAASAYIYDFSSFYKLGWLGRLKNSKPQKILNIHAGFDETSHLLRRRYPSADMMVFDFYDSEKQTEISIKRARKAYPPFPGTRHVEITKLPVDDNSIDIIFAVLSAHEVRSEEELSIFFKELRRVLADKGQLVVTEHLRDSNNFLVYNIGAFHFHSSRTWKKTFNSAGFKICNEDKVTPFITTFILERNGNPS